ncbi:MAG: hypothetical protein PHE47_02345 [Oscillospiraceae bacterium]|nr:hypothetical protein [Oscillospiraceae bacterium]
MITVKKPRITQENGISTVTTEVWFDQEKKELAFWFDSTYEPYLTVDRGDGFLVELFYFAMRYHHDMTFECPISERLLFQIETCIFDANHEADADFYVPKIICQTVDEPYTPQGGAVATGCSCGVDALSSLYSMNEKNDLAGHKVNLLTYFHVGDAMYDNGKEVMDASDRPVNLVQYDNAKRFAQAAELPLLFVDTNFAYEIVMPQGKVHTYRHCGIVLFFQKLFRTYYYASSFNLDGFKVVPSVDCSFADLFTVPNFSTDNVTFYSSDATYSRVRKTQQIADYPLAQQFLNVCWTSGKNCGVCPKCARTQMTLDAFGKLEQFGAVFDLEQHRKKKAMQVGYAVYAHKKDYYYKEIYPLLKKAHKISMASRLWAVCFWLAGPVERWMRKQPPEKRKKFVDFAKKVNLRVPY